ncbi:MAG: GNAT family N-acetyltransferase, partial [Candidatus Dormibacteraceae bacterium]
LYRDSGAPPSAQPAPARLWSVISQTLTAFLPLSYESLLYVAENEGRVAGFVQAAGQVPALTLPPRVTALQLLNLCVRPDVDLQTAASQLLEHLIVRAGQRGVNRLFVRLPLEDPRLPIFQDLGFRWIATEVVLWATLPARLEEIESAAGNDGAHWRAFRRADERSLYELYRRVTPAEVVGMEAPTYLEWKELRSIPGQQEVLEQGQLAAWLRFHQGSGARPHTISLLALPDDAELAQQVVDRAVRRCDGSAAWASLRHYDELLLKAMQRRGFATLLTQGLLVLDLAVRQPVREAGLVPSFG